MTSIISNMPIADYHAHPAISKSGLDKIAQSPAHYRSSIFEPHIQTDAMVIGSAFHDFVLSPHVFETSYTVLPSDFDGRKKDGKELMRIIQESGRIALKHEWFTTIKNMATSVRRHPRAAALLSSGEAEASIFWTDHETGLECRCRPDFIHEKGILVDLKSTVSASPDDFAKSAANLRYHVQDAFYSEGYYRAHGKWARGFVFIAVEKTAPFAVACYELDDEARELGRALFQDNLRTLAQAKQTDTWTAYSEEIETLSLPRWAFN
ncbi:MAG: PD-(D/E)XK nuclease-like domain-containing protein [Neisseria sp.]|nr:PD-(D/E)XK nuclease-like domain-containing protein [Neisseria sp.]